MLHLLNHCHDPLYARIADVMSKENVSSNIEDESPDVENHRTIVGRRRRAVTEKKIIRAAIQVFAKQGLDAPVIDDFIKAAGIARGTFYNYFKNTDELLRATSETLSNEQMKIINRIVGRISRDPVIRFGVGLRIWLRLVQSDPAKCLFIARIGLANSASYEIPFRDIREGLRKKMLTAPDAYVAWDVVYGAIRQAMFRIGEGNVSQNYGEDVVRLCLQTLGTRAEAISEIMTTPIPEGPSW